MQHSRSDQNDDFTSNPLAEDFYKMLRQGRSFSGLERNCFFLNTNGNKKANGRFANVSAVSGVDFPDDSRAIAHVDWDHDGDLDMWISNRSSPRLRLMRNDANSENDFIQFGLTGNGKDTNQNAIGARVTVFLKTENLPAESPTELNQTVYGGDGFISQGTRWLHFGLGSDAGIDRIEVRWPNHSNEIESFPAPGINGRYELVQGSGVATPVDLTREELVLKPALLKGAPKDENHRIPMVFQLSAPPITYITFDDQKNEIETGAGEALLVNIWSSTCRPCLGELKEFSERYEELQQAGIGILAVSVDALAGEVETPVESSEATAKRLEMPFNVGMADPLLIDKLRRLHNHLIKLERPLPLPTSFLIDRSGNIDVIYKGAVTVDTLLADVEPVGDDLLARFKRAAAFEGSVLDDPATLAPLAMEGSVIHLKLGREMITEGRVDDALAEYAKAIERTPDSPYAHNDYGIALKFRREYEKSVDYFREAVRLDPLKPQFRVNLAQTLITLNQLDEAREQLESVVADIAGHSDAHFYLGVIKLRSNDVDGAMASLQRALASKPNHAQAHFTIGGLYMKNRQFAEARIHFEKTLAIDSGQPVVLANLAMVAIQEGRWAEAEQHCRTAIEFQPGYADAHFILGLAYRQRGREFDARQCFELALKYDPSHARARNALLQSR